ncbi:MAG: FlgD immunoglobulin-like domain containing protein [Bacteroidota bacterium]
MKIILIFVVLAAALSHAHSDVKREGRLTGSILLRTQPLWNPVHAGTASSGSNIDTVVATLANEKAPFIAVTDNGGLLYAIYEMTPVGSARTEIEIMVSTNGGHSWQYFGGVLSNNYSLGRPKAFIAVNKLHVVCDLKYSPVDFDLLYFSFTTGPVKSDFFFNLFEISELNTWHPSILVKSDGRILVSSLDETSQRFRIDFSTNGGSNFLHEQTGPYANPAGLQHVDAAYNGSVAYFSYVTGTSGVDQITVLENSSGTTWTPAYTTTGSVNKWGPFIGSYGSSWIVAYQAGSTCRYIFHPATGPPVDNLLSVNASYAAVDINATGNIIAVYIKESLLYRRIASVTAPAFDTEQLLSSMPVVPGESDFLGLNVGPASGILFSSLSGPNNYNLYYAHYPPTGVVPGETETPASIQLLQNYPNPFNPETQIDFQLERRQEINLDIYNISGQLVRTLAAGEFEVGSHSVKWDGKDHSGIQLATGTYFYQVRTQEGAQMRKMLLLK